MPPPLKNGGKPPSVIATPAAPVEPVSPVVAAEPAPVHVEPAKPDVAPAPAPSEGPKQGAFEIADAVSTFVRPAAQPEPAPPESQALAPAAKPLGTHIAKVRVFIGGERGYVEPGQAFSPAASDIALMLAQGTIAPVE